MNSKQRYNAKRAAEHRAKKAADRQFEDGITKLLGCSLSVARAICSPSLRDKQEGGGVCLPEIAIYNAGYRTVRKDAVHIVK